jgi:hypothetical protein
MRNYTNGNKSWWFFEGNKAHLEYKHKSRIDKKPVKNDDEKKNDLIDR